MNDLPDALHLGLAKEQMSPLNRAKLFEMPLQEFLSLFLGLPSLLALLIARVFCRHSAVVFHGHIAVHIDRP